MAYKERLAERIRSYFRRRKDEEKKRMFGGLCFMLNGHMCYVRIRHTSEATTCPRDLLYLIVVR